MRKKIIAVSAFGLLVLLFVAFLIAYRYVGVGGRVMKIGANVNKGFSTEYYLFIPDTLKISEKAFLLVESNNTGFVDDTHKTHMDIAHNIIRFGQANRIARTLGIPLLVPCFDRPETDWEKYTHALDRDTILWNEGKSARIDKQLIAMIADAHMVLYDQNIGIQEKILMNGFSASGTFANRFTALYPEKVAGVAAGGINGMVILPAAAIDEFELIYPVGISGVDEIAGVEFQLQQFSSVPQYYYMGENDRNDSLPYEDAFSDLEREIITEVLGEDMAIRWDNCRRLYKDFGIRAEFHIFEGVGHETPKEIDVDIAAFFIQVMNEHQ